MTHADHLEHSSGDGFLSGAADFIDALAGD